MHNAADLLFSNLIGSTLHVHNKTNEQSAFKITPIWVQNIRYAVVESAWIWTDPTELHFSLFYWFKRCTWRRELLCAKLVTSQLKHQTWRATWRVLKIRSVIEFRQFSESKKRWFFRAEWNDPKLLRCQQQGKKFALFFARKDGLNLKSFNERRVVDIVWTSWSVWFSSIWFCFQIENWK